MNHELIKQTQTITARLVLDSADVVAFCRAEQEFRAVASRSFLAALGTAFATAGEAVARFVADASILVQHRLHKRDGSLLG